ncbi:hypothetical protein F4604DRAFT_1679216 [Suillus subluteus]|nr:hypothetical protein F4604DRAFT_1679216 [Suillus subluteus]
MSEAPRPRDTLPEYLAWERWIEGSRLDSLLAEMGYKEFEESIGARTGLERSVGRELSPAVVELCCDSCIWLEDRELIPVLSLTFCLTRPDSWQVQYHIVEALLDHSNLGSAVSDESQRKWEPFVFEDANDDFYFHFPSFPPADRTTDPITRTHSTVFPLEPESQTRTHTKPPTSGDERVYTLQFSPSCFFRAIDEFRSGTEDTNPDTWRIGEAVSSTQTVFGKCVSGFKGSSSVPGPTILLSNLIFIQYLYALAIIHACPVLDPASEWAHKPSFKFTVNAGTTGNRQDTGSGPNILNSPPIASLAQLAYTLTPRLSVECVAAAIFTSFERIQSSFLQNEEQGFARSWINTSNHGYIRQCFDRLPTRGSNRDPFVTLTTRTPHRSVRIVGITPNHWLLRTVTMGGGEFIDLQPDGNSFDMMKGVWRDTLSEVEFLVSRDAEQILWRVAAIGMGYGNFPDLQYKPAATAARKGTRALAGREIMKDACSPPRTNVIDKSVIDTRKWPWLEVGWVSTPGKKFYYAQAQTESVLQSQIQTSNDTLFSNGIVRDAVQQDVTQFTRHTARI